MEGGKARLEVEKEMSEVAPEVLRATPGESHEPLDIKEHTVVTDVGPIASGQELTKMNDATKEPQKVEKRRQWKKIPY